MKIGPLPDALPAAVKPGFHCARTHWIRGLMAFQLVRRTRAVMLVVSACPESGFLGCAARLRPTSYLNEAFKSYGQAILIRHGSLPGAQQHQGRFLSGQEDAE
jgi:hypothetical protein